MPKPTPETKQPQVVTEEVASEEVTLDEYCIRKSRTDKRVELIGAFHFDEKRQRHVKSTEAAFESRFEAFVNKPA